MWITGPKFQTKRKQKSSLEKTCKNVWEARRLSKGPCSSSPRAAALPSCFIVCNNLEERMAKVTPALCKHGEKKGKLGAVSLSFPTSYCRQYRYISISVCTVGIPMWDLLCYLKTVPQVYMLSNLFLWSFLLSSSLPLGNLRSPTWKVKSIPKDCIFVVYFNSFRMKKFFISFQQ